MILEGIVTTISAAGKTNLTPMGPHFIEGDNRFELRPFETSTTYQNLCENPCGVLHITDDISLFALSAINQLEELPTLSRSTHINGEVLKDCCRWFEFEATENPTDGPRKSFECRTVHSEQGARDFYGFNRARHAILEATILATRVGLIPQQEILIQFATFETIVNKTGGQEELRLFDVLQGFVSGQTSDGRS